MRRQPNALVASALDTLERSAHSGPLGSIGALTGYGHASRRQLEESDRAALRGGGEPSGQGEVPLLAMETAHALQRQARGHLRTRSHPTVVVDETDPAVLAAHAHAHSLRTSTLPATPWAQESHRLSHPHLHHAANLRDVSEQLAQTAAAQDPWRVRSSSMDLGDSKQATSRGSPRSLRKRLGKLTHRRSHRKKEAARDASPGSTTTDPSRSPSQSPAALSRALSRLALSENDLRAHGVAPPTLQMAIAVLNGEASTNYGTVAESTSTAAAVGTQGTSSANVQPHTGGAAVASGEALPLSQEHDAAGSSNSDTGSLIAPAEAAAATATATAGGSHGSPELPYPSDPYEPLPELPLGHVTIRLKDLELHLNTRLAELLAQFSNDYTVPLPPSPITLEVCARAVHKTKQEAVSIKQKRGIARELTVLFVSSSSLSPPPGLGYARRAR